MYLHAVSEWYFMSGALERSCAVSFHISPAKKCQEDEGINPHGEVFPRRMKMYSVDGGTQCIKLSALSPSQEVIIPLIHEVAPAASAFKRSFLSDLYDLYDRMKTTEEERCHPALT